MNTLLPLCLVACLGLASFSQADIMENAEKKKIIRDLNKLLEATKSAENKALNTAIGRLSSAGKNPNQAFDLMTNAKKILIDRNDERKEGLSARIAANTYRDWLEKEAKRYQNDPALKGLMIQYQWGVLVLKARLKENMLKATGDEETPDLTEFKQPAMALINAYVEACADPAFIQGAVISGGGGKRGDGGQRRGIPGFQLARKSVLSTDVGEVLGIGSMGAEGFPESLNNIDKAIDTLFLDEYRKTRDAEGIRATWNKKIALKITLEKYLNDAKQSDDKKNRKDGQDAELKENMEKMRTNMRWQCENDCFDAGDQVLSINNMLSIIKSTIDPIEKENKINALKAKIMESMRKASSDEKPAKPLEEQDSPYTITTKVPMNEDGTPMKKKKSKPSPAPKTDKNEPAVTEQSATVTPTESAPPTEEVTLPESVVTPATEEEKPITSEAEEGDDFFDDM